MTPQHVAKLPLVVYEPLTFVVMEQAAGDHAYLHMTLTNTCTLPVAVRSPALISDKISLTQLHGELPKVCCSVLLHSRKLLCTKKYFQNNFSYILYMYSLCHYRRAWRHVELPVAIAKMSWIYTCLGHAQLLCMRGGACQ